ncbi:hypothetical protein KEM55_000273 [Ascosphaera atra]|nr:hypothetical protein KEM55_000273 [Ascosphaera atra]
MEARNASVGEKEGGSCNSSSQGDLYLHFGGVPNSVLQQLLKDNELSQHTVKKINLKEKTVLTMAAGDRHNAFSTNFLIQFNALLQSAGIRPQVQTILERTCRTLSGTMRADVWWKNKDDQSFGVMEVADTQPYCQTRRSLHAKVSVWMEEGGSDLLTMIAVKLFQDGRIVLFQVYSRQGRETFAETCEIEVNMTSGDLRVKGAPVLCIPLGENGLKLDMSRETLLAITEAILPESLP